MKHFAFLLALLLFAGVYADEMAPRKEAQVDSGNGLYRLEIEGQSFKITQQESVVAQGVMSQPTPPYYEAVLSGDGARFALIDTESGIFIFNSQGEKVEFVDGFDLLRPTGQRVIWREGDSPVPFRCWTKTAMPLEVNDKDFRVQVGEFGHAVISFKKVVTRTGWGFGKSSAPPATPETSAFAPSAEHLVGKPVSPALRLGLAVGMLIVLFLFGRRGRGGGEALE